MKRIWAISLAMFMLLAGAAASHAELYFPHVTTIQGWQTEICIINPGATQIVGNLISYNKNGTQVNSQQVNVQANRRVQYNVATLANAATTDYIVYKNTGGWPVGYTKFTPSSGDRVAIPSPDNPSSGNIYVTHIAWNPWWTGIALVNTTTQTKNLTLRFNNGATRPINLGPRQKQVFQVAELFGWVAQPAIVSAVIENASGVVGLELFGSGNQLGGVPLVSTTASTLYFPHVANDASWWTGLAAYNPSTAAAPITVRSYSTGGALLRTSSSSIPAGGRFFGASSLPALNLPANTAWFSIESQKPLVGFELFGTTDNRRLAGYSVLDLEGREGIFPKLEKSGWTGIAFVNTENKQTTVTVKAIDDAGAVKKSASKVLKPYEKWVGLPVDQTASASLFPWADRNAVNAATYLSFTANGNVAGFQLNNTTDNTKLDALQVAAPSALKVIDKALAFFKYQSDLTSGMTALTDILGQILSEDAAVTCPVVTITPPLDSLDLEHLPPAITLKADYGTGCKASDGSTMSGSVTLAITGLTMTETALNLNFALTPTNLKRNGTVVLSGSVTGNIAFSNSAATINVQFNNFGVAGSNVTGALKIVATDLDISEIDAGGITITVTNLTAAGYTVYSGTLVLTGDTEDMTIDANLNTSQGIVDIVVRARQASDTRIIVSTVGQNGTIGGYTVVMSNVALDTTVCNGYPSSGTVTITQGGSTFTKTFTAATCQQLTEEDALYDAGPGYDLGPASYRMPFVKLVEYFFRQSIR